MTTETITLSSFLLARIAEDEEAAQAALDPERPGTHWRWERGEDDVAVVEPTWEDMPVSLRTVEMFPTAAVGELPAFVLNHVEVDEPRALPHIARHNPARVLAECAAKRAIVELHAAYPTLQVMVYGTITACSECGSVDDSPVEWPCPTLRTLGAVYADAPQFREEWRP